jgi:dolichol-phosphate mannosyltransferase
MISVIIPCYKVSIHICDLISNIGDEVDEIIVIDDCCPENSGKIVEDKCHDPRVRVIFHESNQGVGGAVLTGYKAAIDSGASVIVKLDGDGQMDPALIPAFISPIEKCEADYTKGNRFFEIETVRQMPAARLIGNVGLSFLTKLSSGYWNLFDPTNGYTAINAKVAEHLPMDKINRRFFFESDMLFRLNTMRAVLIDIPMFAEYGLEKSNLSIARELPKFFINNLKNLVKRITYNYFIRNFNYASFELIFGLFLLGFGVSFGGLSWFELAHQGTLASSGTVMLAALPIILGIQLMLGFLNYDMASIPSIPLQGRLHSDARKLAKNSTRIIKK